MKGKDWFGLVLVLLGLLLLGDNLNLFSIGSIFRLWPAVLIVLGLWLFIKKDDNKKKTTVEVSFQTVKPEEPTVKVEPEEVKADTSDDDEDEI